MAGMFNEVREKINRALSDGDPHKDIWLTFLDIVDGEDDKRKCGRGDSPKEEFKEEFEGDDKDLTI